MSKILGTFGIFWHTSKILGSFQKSLRISEPIRKNIFQMDADSVDLVGLSPFWRSVCPKLASWIFLQLFPQKIGTAYCSSCPRSWYQVLVSIYNSRCISGNSLVYDFRNLKNLTKQVSVLWTRTRLTSYLLPHIMQENSSTSFTSVSSQPKKIHRRCDQRVFPHDSFVDADSYGGGCGREGGPWRRYNRITSENQAVISYHTFCFAPPFRTSTWPPSTPHVQRSDDASGIEGEQKRCWESIWRI